MSPLLFVHVTAAAVALVSGAVALSVPKGRRLHRRSGQLFVAAMLTMCAAAIVLAAAKGQTMNLIAGVLTAYLVITALTTVRPIRGASPWLDAALMGIAVALALITLAFGVQALASPTGEAFGLPPFPFFMFAIVGLIAGAGDVRVIRRGPLHGVARLRRHLWRMCWALWIATISFFSIRARVARVFPAALVTPALQIAPVVLVLAAMVYWLWRVRAKRAIPMEMPGGARATPTV